MNTISQMSLLGQSTNFEGKIVRNLTRHKRRFPNTVRNDLSIESQKSRILSLKNLIKDDPAVAGIYKNLESGVINTEEAAKQILDTIA